MGNNTMNNMNMGGMVGNTNNVFGGGGGFAPSMQPASTNAGFNFPNPVQQPTAANTDVGFDFNFNNSNNNMNTESRSITEYMHGRGLQVSVLPRPTKPGTQLRGQDPAIIHA